MPCPRPSPASATGWRAGCAAAVAARPGPPPDPADGRSTSTPSTPTPTTWSAAPPARRSGSPPSRCGSRRCCAAGAGATTASPACSPTPCARRSGCYEQGISDDLVVAYPTVDRAALGELVASPAAAAAITLMVDDVAHLDVVDSRAPRRWRSRSGSRSTSTPGCGSAASTSGPSGRRSTTPTTWSRLARTVIERRGLHGWSA